VWSQSQTQFLFLFLFLFLFVPQLRLRLRLNGGKCDWTWELGRVPGKMLFNQHLHSMNFEFSETQP